MKNYSNGEIYYVSEKVKCFPLPNIRRITNGEKEWLFNLTSIQSFVGEFTIVQESTGEFGVINRELEILIPCKYKSLSWTESLLFATNYAGVSFYVNVDGLEYRIN